MFRSIVRSVSWVAALLVSVAAHAQPAPAGVTLTAEVDALTCTITTFTASGRESVAAPCDPAGTTFDIAANQSLDVLADFSYRYHDSGNTFEGGVLAACTRGPCVVDPNATHEYGQLWATFSFCTAGAGCSERAYPIFLPLTNGPDARSSSQLAYEVIYPSAEARTVTVSFDLDTATFSAVSPVPEPATWALLAIGLIAVRLASRRRRDD